jgi:AcrR family transcriptional regulator
MTSPIDDVATTDRPTLVTYEVAFQRVFAALAADDERPQLWLARVSDGLSRVVELFAADPTLARTVMIEALTAGPEGRRLHEEALTRVAECLDSGRKLARGKELPEQISLMAAGAVSGLIFDEILMGRAAQLPAREPDLLFMMLVPFIGPQAATVEMRKVAAQRGT